MARRSTTRGFKRTAMVLTPEIRRVGESRGFAVSRLLTHWAGIVGEDVAAIARPVDVRYGREGTFGATLTLLTTGPQAPMLEMRREQLRRKINAVYGYNAISRVRITQTAATGFEEGAAVFERWPEEVKPVVSAKVATEARRAARDVDDADLRAALERLGRNVLSRGDRLRKECGDRAQPRGCRASNR